MEIKTTAYPKVNLHLAVGSKGPDGYHQIASVFQLVKDLKYKDEIKINIEKSPENIINVTGLEIVADKEDNTIYKASKYFLEQLKDKYRIDIVIEKNIPSQAGLGGGSSDAGFVLLALNSFCPIDFQVLMQIAAKVGSDVPFFVSDCEAAVVMGRGEKVYPIKAKDLHIKLYPNNDAKMSTAKAYALLDSRKIVKPLQTVDYLKSMYQKPISEWDFYNDFEMVNVPTENPAMRLTGSGTCRFTID